MKMRERLAALTRVALVVAALGSTGVASTAEAAVWIGWVRLDNSPNGGSIASTSTTNDIEIRVRFCGDWETIYEGPVSSVSSSHDFLWIDGPGMYVSDVDAIEVSTNGDDWFWLDQIELFEGISDGSLGYEIWDAGVDNMAGYCLSTDPTDGNDSTCNPNGSRSRFVWTVPGSGC